MEIIGIVLLGVVISVCVPLVLKVASDFIVVVTLDKRGRKKLE